MFVVCLSCQKKRYKRDVGGFVSVMSHIIDKSLTHISVSVDNAPRNGTKNNRPTYKIPKHDQKIMLELELV
jgi:hypothetical protein